MAADLKGGVLELQRECPALDALLRQVTRQLACQCAALHTQNDPHTSPLHLVINMAPLPLSLPSLLLF